MSELAATLAELVVEAEGESSMVAKLHVTPSPSASTTSSANVAANSDISGDLASYRSELREVLLAQLRDV